MSIKPIGDRVLIELVDEGKSEIGGIIIPTSSIEQPDRGTVLAVGDGMVGDNGKKTPVTVKSGDVVLLPKHGGTEVKNEGKVYQIIREHDLLAIIN